jgi:hypothetical protein
MLCYTPLALEWIDDIGFYDFHATALCFHFPLVQLWLAAQRTGLFPIFISHGGKRLGLMRDTPAFSMVLERMC